MAYNRSVRAAARTDERRDMGRRRISGLLKRSEGSTSVELVFALPIFLLFAFGIFQFGFIFFVWNEMTNAAREGARRLAVDDTLSEADAQTQVQTALANWPATFTITACKTAATTANATACTANEDVSVTVSAPMSDVAVIGDLFSLLGTNTLTARVVMRKEG